MPSLKITNHDIHITIVSDPHGTFYMTIPPGAVAMREVSVDILENMRAGLEELSARVLADGSPAADVDVIQGRSDADVSFEAATADVTRYLGNRVVYGAFASNPGTASTVSARTYKLAAGEAYVDGEHYIVAAADDIAADGEILSDGTDFSATALTSDKDRYAHLCLVKTDSSVEQILVYGEEGDTGEAVALRSTEIADAVGAYLQESAPVYAFVNIAVILFAEASGVTQTTTDLRPVPASYN